MVRIRDVALALTAAVVTLAAPRPALANPIPLTGFVANDFTPANGSVIVPVYQGPGVIAGPDGSAPGQLVGGFDIQSIRLNYDATTDTMSVGIQGYKNAAGLEQIFGDATGNLDPSKDPSPNFGGSKSVAIAFAPLGHDANGKPVAGSPAIIAGIPSDKSMGGNGTTDGFTVSQFSSNPSGLEFSFGKQLAQYTGNLAYNPSAAHPDLEFTIKNFSQIPGLNMKNGFYLQAYAGAPGDQNGEVQTAWTFSPAPQGFNAPEPMTWLAWMLLAGGAGWRQYRRRLAATARP
jgi:hypothetical protein